MSYVKIKHVLVLELGILVHFESAARIVAIIVVYLLLPVVTVELGDYRFASRTGQKFTLRRELLLVQIYLCLSLVLDALWPLKVALVLRIW